MDANGCIQVFTFAIPPLDWHAMWLKIHIYVNTLIYIQKFTAQCYKIRSLLESGFFKAGCTLRLLR